MAEFAQQIRFCKSADGSRIAYALGGSGPYLVWVQHWVHHLELDLQNPVWRGWLPTLARGRTLVRFDWRGCGLSDRVASVSLDFLVANLESVIDTAGIQRCALFGMAGAGSGIAMTYASRHPEKVDCLILQEAHVKGRLAGEPDQQQIAEAAARLKLIEIGWSDDTPAYRDFFSALHIPAATPVQASAYNRLIRQTTDGATAIKLLQTFWQADFADVARRVACPTIIFHAREDDVIPFDQGRQLAGLIPNAEFVPLESKNHLLLNTERAWPAFVEKLNGFLRTELTHGATPAEIARLTNRQRVVLTMLARGAPNKEIATSLGISEKTVRNHVSAIFSTLNVGSRAEAVARARDAGM